MHDYDQTPPLGASLLTCAELRALLDDARKGGTTLDRLTELTVLVHCDVAQLAWAPIASLNREAEAISVMTDAGEWSTVNVGRFGVEAIDAARGGRTRGPLIMDYDQCLNIDEAALAPVVSVFGGVGRGFHGPYGLFNLIRTSALAHCRSAGVPRSIAAIQGGEPVPKRRAGREKQDSTQQAVEAQMWHGMLGLWSRPGGPRDFHDAARGVRMGEASRMTPAPRPIGITARGVRAVDTRTSQGRGGHERSIDRSGLGEPS